MTLATSQNSKIIVVGGKDGLPLILNTGDEPTSRPEMPAATGSEPASTEPSALAPPPPNARMNDVAPPNAAVPLNLPASSPNSAPADSTGRRDSMSSRPESAVNPATSDQDAAERPRSTVLPTSEQKTSPSP